jgi:ABC-2 type transport system permease protein
MTRWFRTPLSIAGVGIRRLFRDRIGLFFTFLLPLLIIGMLGAAIPSGDRRIGVVDADRSVLSVALLDQVDSAKGLEIRHFDSVDALAKAVRRQQVNGGLAIAKGYDADLRGNATVRVSLYLDQGSSSATALRTAVNSAVGRQAAVIGAARFTRDSTANTPDFSTLIASAAKGEPSLAVAVESTKSTGYQAMTVGQYATAGELVLFVFLISLVGAGELVDSRRMGISRRMLVAACGRLRSFRRKCAPSAISPRMPGRWTPSSD